MAGHDTKDLDDPPTRGAAAPMMPTKASFVFRFPISRNTEPVIP